jgi:hypothetical protein
MNVKYTHKEQTCGVAQAEECLPSKPEVLSSNSTPPKKKKKKKA